MKLSENTLSVIKNFAAINDSLFFKTGNVQRTVSTHKTILVEAVLDEVFPVDFGIHQLNQLLSIMSLSKDGVELEVNGPNAMLTTQVGRSKFTYRCCDETMIKNPPPKNVALPSQDCSFLLTESDMEYILKAASVLSSPNIAVVREADKLFIKTMDAQDDAAHIQTLDMGPAIGPAQTFLFKTENWKMMPGDYTVTLSSKGVSHFQNNARKIQYWVALEQRSS
jgi:hypothetical protein